MDGLDLINAQRSQRQGYQRGNLIAYLQGAVILQILADIGHGADEHTAAAGNGILLLAPLAYDGEDHFADLLLVTAAGFCDLREGGGVDVQALHITDDLVAVESIHVVVDLVSSLSENAFGFNNAMSTVLVAFECHK